MTLFALALYGIPAVLAVITVLIGVQGVKFFFSEVVFAPRTSGEPE